MGVNRRISKRMLVTTRLVGWNDGFQTTRWDLHKIVEGHHLKNNHGDSHSRKKRAAPVDAWPVSNPSRGGNHVKNRKIALLQGPPCEGTCRDFQRIQDAALQFES